MKKKMFILNSLFLLFVAVVAFGEVSQTTKNKSVNKSTLSLIDIIQKIEKRYSAPGFSAVFIQESTVKAMEIVDTAVGKIYVKRPGMMRWEYEKPDKQIIISNGKKIWIFREDDSQVMVGDAPSLFGDGKGASFLSDMTLLKNKFIIYFDDRKSDKYFNLKLIPKKKTYDINVVKMSVQKKTFIVDVIITINSYGDETVIKISDMKFIEKIDDDKFIFNIPEGIDILHFAK